MQDKRFTWMHSGQVGAAQMDGVKLSDGQILGVLDCALVDGFNLLTPESSVKTTSTVTFTYAADHGYENKQILLVSDAEDVNLNGRHRIISKTINTVTIDASGVTDLSGAIVTKVAPLDFESIFGSTTTGKRAYRSKNPESTRTVLYLDTTLPTSSGYSTANPAKRAMVSLCENMTEIGIEINSYTKTIDDKTRQKNRSLFWYQSRPGTKTEATISIEYRSWVIVGNGDVFYLFNEWQDWTGMQSKLRDMYAFGDADSLGGEADQHNCMWMGAINPNDVTNFMTASTGGLLGGSYDSEACGFFIKDHTGIGGIQKFVMTTDGYADYRYTGHNQTLARIPSPNPASQSLICFPIHTLTSKGLRATLPKILALPHDMLNNRAGWDLTITDNLLTVAVFYSRATTGEENGFYAIDLGD